MRMPCHAVARAGVVGLTNGQVIVQHFRSKMDRLVSTATEDGRAPRSEADVLRLIQSQYVSLRLTFIDRLDQCAPFAEDTDTANIFLRAVRASVVDHRRHLSSGLR